MHIQYHKIKEDIEFPKVLTVKQLPGKKTKNWSNRDIKITNTNSEELKPGQGVLQVDLQALHYNLGSMHNLIPNNPEDMVFQIYLLA
jgi:hypothetical protein